MSALQKQESGQVVPIKANGENPYLSMVQSIVASGGDLSNLDKFLDLQIRWEANEARKAFNEAVAAFKTDPPKVIKDKENRQYGSHYATLHNLVNTVSESLAPHGLTARWDVTQDQKISVTCILSHVRGHSESVTMSGPPDSSGSKNELQKIKSTVTYLRGATFEAVTGVASSDSVGVNLSDDANSAAVDTISKEQAAKIRDMLEATGSDERKFLNWLKTDSIESVPVKSFDSVMRTLKAKEKAK